MAWKDLNPFVRVVKRHFHYIITEQDWDPDVFLKEGILAFLDEYQGFLSQEFTESE